MPLYNIKINYEHIVEADNEEEAVANWEEELATSNETILNNIFDYGCEIKEVCPHCEIELKSKMTDVDGTNLVESNICEKCGYGTPALR